MSKSKEESNKSINNKKLYLFNGVVINGNYIFTIISKTKEYKYNKYSIYSSKLIEGIILINKYSINSHEFLKNAYQLFEFQLISKSIIVLF